MRTLHQQLQRQLCTVSQSTEMSRLGIVTVCQFYFYQTADRFDWYIAHRSNIKEIEGDLWAIEEHGNAKISKTIGAYTVAELGTMLFASRGETTTWDALSHSYRLPNDKTQSQMFDTEAECRADQVITMISKGLLSIEAINSRLTAFSD